MATKKQARLVPSHMQSVRKVIAVTPIWAVRLALLLAG